MDQANRDAYLSAYDNAIRRHGISNTLSTTPTTVKAAASSAAVRAVDMNFGEAAHRSFRIVWSYLIWAIGCIAYYVLLPALALYLLLILLGVPQWERWANETLLQLQQGHWYLQPNYGSIAVNTAIVIALCILHPIKTSRAVGNGIQIALVDTRAWLGEKLNDRRYNQRADNLLLRYRMVRNWVINHKFWILYSLFFLWLFSGSIGIGSEHDGRKKFVQWKDFQPSFTNPIPKILYQTPKEEGSNSYYRRGEPIAPAESTVHEESEDAGDVKELPVETIHDQWYEWPPFEPSTFESTMKSAREDNTAVPHTNTFTSTRSRQEIWDEGSTAKHPRETFVGGSWDERIRADMKADMRKRNVRTYVGEGLVYCLSCKQWHCCEVPY